MAKSAEAFRTISEVSDWLETPAHVLRFWESRFSQIKPVKRAGGRRYYRPGDMQLLGGIRRLLHDDGITIKGVQKIIREKGVKYVAGLSHPLPGDETEAAEQTTVTTAAPETTPIDDILSHDAPVEARPVVAPVSAAVEAVAPEASDDEDEAPYPDRAASAAHEIRFGRQAREAEAEDEAQAPDPAELAGDFPSPSAQGGADVTSERLVALYHRLKALRDRVHAEAIRA